MSFLAKEAEHVDGFAKECAVVTHHRLCTDPKSGGLMPDPEARLEVRTYVCVPYLFYFFKINDFFILVAIIFHYY